MAQKKILNKKNVFISFLILVIFAIALMSVYLSFYARWIDRQFADEKSENNEVHQLYNAASLHYNEDQFDQALFYLNSVIEQSAFDEEIHSVALFYTALSYFKKGEQLKNEDKIDEALNAFEKARLFFYDLISKKNELIYQNQLDEKSFYFYSELNKKLRKISEEKNKQDEEKLNKLSHYELVLKIKKSEKVIEEQLKKINEEKNKYQSEKEMAESRDQLIELKNENLRSLEALYKKLKLDKPPQSDDGFVI